MSLGPSDLVLVKTETYQGKRKVKDWWDTTLHEVVCPITQGVPSYIITDATGHEKVLHHNRLFLVTSVRERGKPLCVSAHVTWSRCTGTTPDESTVESSGKKEKPQEYHSPMSTLHQVRQTTLGWVDGKLGAMPWMLAEASMQGVG